MSEIYMTFCDACAERLDAEKHPENKYYLTEIQGSRRTMTCPRCFQLAACTQYSLESKTMRAARKQWAGQRQGAPKKDRRAHYRGPWREQ